MLEHGLDTLLGRPRRSRARGADDAQAGGPEPAARHATRVPPPLRSIAAV